ncbi:MAG TPA: pyruvate, phosphate dikinase [Candidatus Angelobacter sp.]|jgi:pyruvate,orthophosphate dikinase|nr:pyruvate, phosphate dikinase [Candidatus Angelobacter sp.]
MAIRSRTTTKKKPTSAKPAKTSAKSKATTSAKRATATRGAVVTGRAGLSGNGRVASPAAKSATLRIPRAQHRWVYLFEEGDASMRDLLGGKGAGVAEMTRAGLPVPPGFTITTEACNAFYTNRRRFPEGMWDQAMQALKHLERKSGKQFGDPKNPLLVSVRSGARFSMPGMMDTVLNLGLNAETLQGLATLTGNERFALDAYRRFIQLFSKIVLGIDGAIFEHALDESKQRNKAETDADLQPAALKQLIDEYKQIVRDRAGVEFPEDPYDQLEQAIGAVFSSWNNKRAMDYRNFNKISHDLGTAVNVQTMVFGNMGDDSATGVAFTRDPSTGEKVLYGEYLPNAQGEDVVAGIRTPHPIADMKREMPRVYAEFDKIAQRLEKHYRDVQDMEFTIERGRLYMLQTRSGKRTAAAAVKVAVDMAHERLINRQEAVQRVEPGHIDQLLHTRIDPAAKVDVMATGLAASPGAAYGKAVFDADTAEAWAKRGEKVILVRIETNPDDVHGMIAAQGVLTSRGGRTSHAAVVARGMGKPCVAGAESVKVDLNKKQFTAGGRTIKEGEEFTIDGSTGHVIFGTVPMIEPEISGDLEELLRWADQIRRLGVWANGDYPHDATRAREFGAEGIGLCRTEHMFMEQERLPVVQRMILSSTTEERRGYLDELLPMQRGDFYGILKAMQGLPVVIRLIDPPLHEFLPSLEDLLVEVTRAEALGRPEAEYAEQRRLLAAVRDLHEQNPMLGLRGCRLGLLFPEIIEMQTRAIIEAAAQLKQERVDVRPEIMVPLVGAVEELKRTREVIDRVAKQVIKESGVKVSYKVGTMIEIPRAALTAGEIATEAEFFSFGTNDLTQTTFGYSRDDAEGKFLLKYVEEKILPYNPFESLDRNGVARLMDIAVHEGRAARPKLKVGICGEHGGDPASIQICEDLGLDYVSCSPYRVPIARLAAAQARLATAERDR